MSAMATATKFTFDLDFDAPEEALQPAPVEEEVEVEEEEVVPTFSEEELAQARAEGFDAGKEEGRKESAEATEQRILETVESLTSKLADIYNDQAQANHDIAQEMIEISTVIAKKMFPDLNARNALGEVERVVQDTLKAITDEPRVQIMVHPDIREPLTDHLAAMTQRAGFEGKVYVNPDNTINLGDCRVEWSHGAAVRDSETIMEMIDEIIERNLHGEDIPIVEPIDEQESDEPIDAPVNEETDEREMSVPSEPENVESSEEDTQPEPSALEDTTASETDEILSADPVDEENSIDNDHFAPSANIDDDISALTSNPEIQENQQVDDDMGEAPVPHIETEQDQTPEMTSDVSTEADEVIDDPTGMVNSDPVSPDMTAAILDAQGAMSEEEDK